MGCVLGWVKCMEAFAELGRRGVLRWEGSNHIKTHRHRERLRLVRWRVLGGGGCSACVRWGGGGVGLCSPKGTRARSSARVHTCVCVRVFPLPRTSGQGNVGAHAGPVGRVARIAAVRPCGDKGLAGV